MWIGREQESVVGEAPHLDPGVVVGVGIGQQIGPVGGGDPDRVETLLGLGESPAHRFAVGVVRCAAEPVAIAPGDVEILAVGGDMDPTRETNPQRGAENDVAKKRGPGSTG